jgi:hypothetical protein
MLGCYLQAIKAIGPEEVCSNISFLGKFVANFDSVIKVDFGDIKHKNGTGDLHFCGKHS